MTTPPVVWITNETKTWFRLLLNQAIAVQSCIGAGGSAYLTSDAAACSPGSLKGRGDLARRLENIERQSATVITEQGEPKSHAHFPITGIAARTVMEKAGAAQDVATAGSKADRARRTPVLTRGLAELKALFLRIPRPQF